MPKRLPVRSPKINKKTLCDCKYAVRIQLILKSQRQRDLKYLEEKILGLCNYGGLIDTLFTDVEGVA